MSLVQGGPPEWIWERTPHPMKFQVTPSRSLDGHAVYELRVNCGLEIMRLQFFTPEELRSLAAVISEQVVEQPTESRAG